MSDKEDKTGDAMVSEEKKKTNSNVAADLMKGSYSDGDSSSDDDLFGDDDDKEKKQDKSLSSSSSKPPTKNKLSQLDEESDSSDSDIGDTVKKKDRLALPDSSDSDSSDGGQKRKLAKKKGKKNNDEGGPNLVENEDGDFVAPKEAIAFPDSIHIPDCKAVREGEELRLAKMSQVLHLEPRCYDETLYSEAGEANRLDALGKQYCGENVIRWRFQKDKDGQTVIDKKTGEPAMESNARFVQWSDGSMQLLVGEQTFDCVRSDVLNNFAYSMMHDSGVGKKCLEAQGLFNGTYSFRPTSLTSSAHKAMEIKVKQRMLKSVKVKTMVVTKDPQLEQDEKMRAIDGRLRLQQRQRQKQSSKASKLSKSYLEDGYDDGPRGSKKTSVKHVKNRVFGDGDSEDEDDSSESDSEEDRARFKSRTKEAQKKSVPSDSDEEDTKPKGGKRATISDSDDDSVDKPAASKKRKVVLESDSEDSD